MRNYVRMRARTHESPQELWLWLWHWLAGWRGAFKKTQARYCSAIISLGRSLWVCSVHLLVACTLVHIFSLPLRRPRAATPQNDSHTITFIVTAPHRTAVVVLLLRADAIICMCMSAATATRHSPRTSSSFESTAGACFAGSTAGAERRRWCVNEKDVELENWFSQRASSALYRPDIMPPMRDMRRWRCARGFAGRFVLGLGDCKYHKSQSWRPRISCMCAFGFYEQYLLDGD